MAGPGGVLSEQARLAGDIGLLRVGRGIIGIRPLAGVGHRCRSGVLRSGRMVAGAGRPAPVALIALQALSSADRDGSAARRADAAGSGERFGRGGPAPLGSALVAW